MKHGPEKIKCPKCEGNGEIDMPSTHARTLRLFTKSSDLSADVARDKLGEDITVNALNGRLEDLRELGRLDRYREGKTYFYFLPVDAGKRDAEISRRRAKLKQGPKLKR